MWDKARIMRMAERTLKRTEAYRKNRSDSSDPETNYQLDYVLAKGSKSVPDTAIAYAHYEDETILFNPFQSSNVKSILDWAFNFDDDLFMHLEQGYDLAGMSLETHSVVWKEISECHGEGIINYSTGMQHYLNYCKRNGVTVELLRQELQYDGMDVMGLYDKTAFKEKSPQKQER